MGYNPLGRLPGSVWAIPSEPLLIPDETRQALDLPDHFAAFPQEWPRRIVTGWSPIGICTVCGEGRRPMVEKEQSYPPVTSNNDGTTHRNLGPGSHVGYAVATIDSYVCSCPTPTEQRSWADRQGSLL